MLFRSDSPDKLTPQGWAALQAEGIRTLIDLRNDDERECLAPLPDGLVRIHVPLDGQEDREFWADWIETPDYGTPRYYGPHLRRMPERSATVLRAILEAEAGILFHCVLGRDRTGMVALMLLHLLGAEPFVLVKDYMMSVRSSQLELIDVTLDFLEGYAGDVEALLTSEERTRLRRRFLENDERS